MKHRMVDQIVEWERGRRIRGSKAVSFEEYSLRGTLGEPERLPESLMLESLLQLGNWLLVLSSEFAEMGMVTEVGPVRFEGTLGPGERMRMDVCLVETDAGDSVFTGAGRCGSRTVIVAQTWRMRRCDLIEYQNPQDLRVQYEEIHRPGMGVSA